MEFRIFLSFLDNYARAHFLLGRSKYQYLNCIVFLQKIIQCSGYAVELSWRVSNFFRHFNQGPKVLSTIFLVFSFCSATVWANGTLLLERKNVVSSNNVIFITYISVNLILASVIFDSVSCLFCQITCGLYLINLMKIQKFLIFNVTLEEPEFHFKLVLGLQSVLN